MATDSTPYVHGKELDRLGGRVALGVLDMLFSTPEWIHRRVEKVELTTGLPHFRRRVSLDLTLPNPDITGIKWTDSERVTLVPVDVLAKQPLRRFSIIDAEGRPLPVLTRRQNGEIAWRGMEAYAQQVLSSADTEPITPSLSESFKLITQGPVSAALAETEALLSRQGRAAEALAADDGFTAAAEMLARNFVLIAVLAPAPGRRQILKYEYEHSSASDRDDRTRRERILESFGWSPTAFEVPAPSFMDCETFHAEVLLALVAAVLPIAAAWLLVFPGPGRILSMGWTVLVVVSWLLASVLAAVWRAPQG